jgi:hypothetical protein
VHDLGVLHFLKVRQPGRRLVREGVHDLQPRGRQAEHAIKSRQVLPDIGHRGRRSCRWGEFQQHDGLPAAGDPAIQQRLDAVGNRNCLGA